ncbi:unnamed protein product [Linum trigynum]|uniref:Uncharacterized protein n=1 Tax=Linum trigynum TaxID=586398 RepID=A0AAV2CKC8_9ROSI
MDGGVTATGFNGVPSAPLALGNIGHGTSSYQGQQQVIELKPQLFLQQQERSAGSIISVLAARSFPTMSLPWQSNIIIVVAAVQAAARRSPTQSKYPSSAEAMKGYVT